MEKNANKDANCNINQKSEENVNEITNNTIVKSDLVEIGLKENLTVLMKILKKKILILIIMI